jgi:hypothetical protein
MLRDAARLVAIYEDPCRDKRQGDFCFAQTREWWKREYQLSKEVTAQMVFNFCGAVQELMF